MSPIRTWPLLMLVTTICYVVEAIDETAQAQSDDLTEAWSKYDFIPGTPVLFYDDFSGERIGQQPMAWKLIEGKTEVMQFQNQRWLHAIEASFVAPQIAKLPSQFTLEMDFYVIPQGYSGSYRIDVYGQTDEDWVTLTIEDLGVYFNTSSGIDLAHELELKGRHHLAMIAGEEGYKCYIDSLRIFEVTKLGNFRARDLELFMAGGEKEGDDKCMITDFKLAATKSFRDQIEEQGKIISYGIVFVKGSAALAPQSTPTIKELAKLLQADLGLNLSIECHVYELADEGDNTRLSQQRAEALRELLTSQYKINRERLRTKGWGSAQPIKDKDTVVAHAANPRVEFVKR
ncbi:MAG: OmpA family protein [candidate division KSB1 bacterium]|nr:OmpA family protein [candidate division KSB1 bacterium]MDZ7301068.1 OmpA family protein [candidate division KSB1 bacterium]MDZ7312108.1 OmpA family protein [candidate division KSB1 bacterium]